MYFYKKIKSHISIHAPLARCDFAKKPPKATDYNFNPRTSCEVRQSKYRRAFWCIEFQSTHLLRGATSSPKPLQSPILFQSTHLLRGATSTTVLPRRIISISIHAPLARCDRAGRADRRIIIGFQSTHLLRGATARAFQIVLIYKFQSTHLLRGATEKQVGKSFPQSISIHAPLARCDQAASPLLLRKLHFNPRTSCEVRLVGLMLFRIYQIISIHAPLARCDRIR